MRRLTIGLTLLAAAAPSGATMAGAIEFTPAFAPTVGLRLMVQNYSKLPQTIERVDVAIGGGGTGCVATLPRLDLNGAERSSMVVADARTVARCVGPAGGRALTAELPVLAEVPTRPVIGRPVAVADAAPMVRLEPRITGAAAVAPIVFRLAAPVAVTNGRPPPIIRRP